MGSSVNGPQKEAYRNESKNVILKFSGDLLINANLLRRFATYVFSNDFKSSRCTKRFQCKNVNGLGIIDYHRMSQIDAENKLLTAQNVKTIK